MDEIARIPADEAGIFKRQSAAYNPFSINSFRIFAVNGPFFFVDRFCGVPV
jgi:hypothetical protein